MAVIVSVEEIRGFFNMNKSSLRDEYRLVAEEEEDGIEVYITSENDLPYFTVELEGVVEYEADVSSEAEIETVYSQLLNLFICGYGSEPELDSECASRVVEIYDATVKYLSILLEVDPGEYFDDDCIEEIASAFEEYLYDAYGLSARHPIVDGGKIILYPNSEEV